MPPPLAPEFRARIPRRCQRSHLGESYKHAVGKPGVMRRDGDSPPRYEIDKNSLSCRKTH